MSIILFSEQCDTHRTIHLSEIGNSRESQDLQSTNKLGSSLGKSYIELLESYV